MRMLVGVAIVLLLLVGLDHYVYDGRYLDGFTSMLHDIALKW